MTLVEAVQHEVRQGRTVPVLADGYEPGPGERAAIEHALRLANAGDEAGARRIFDQIERVVDGKFEVVG